MSLRTLAGFTLGAFLLTVAGPAAASIVLGESIAVVADPVTLDREVTIGTTPVLLYVVYTNPVAGLGSVSAVEFGVELDEGLTLLGTSTDGLVLEPAEDEFVVSFPFCGQGSGPEPFEIMQLIVAPTGAVAPGAGVRLRSRDPGTDVIQGRHCYDTTVPVDIVNLGGVVINPAGPAVAGFGSSDPVAVEGRSYQVAWETVGAAEWVLDGVAVGARGSTEFVAASSRIHRLESADGQTAAELTVEVIRAPRIRSFALDGEPEAGRQRVRWDVAGVASCRVSGVGEVPPRGTARVDLASARVIDLAAANEWGSSVEALEFSAPVAPPEILAFSANPPDPGYGEPVVLEYLTEHATELLLEPSPGRVSVHSSSTVIEVVQSGTWTLTASNALGTATAEVSFADPLPRIHWFTVSPKDFGPSVEIEISWGAEGADEVWMEPGGTLAGSEGERTFVSPDSTETWVLFAANAFGVATDSLLIAPQAPFLTLGLQPTYAEGEPIVLTYQSRWSDGITLTPPGLAVPFEDFVVYRRTVHPVGVTTYRLESTNEIGTTIREATIRPGPPKIVEFSLDPVPSLTGQPFDIVYHVYGADELEFEGFPGLVLPDTASLVMGRISYTYTEAYQGPAKLTARNELGFIWDYTDASYTVRDRDRLMDYCHFDPPTVSPGQHAWLAWRGPNWADHVMTDEDGVVVSEPGRYNGYTRIYPEPGTHFYVLTSSHRSLVQTDTAWVTAGPVHQFSVDRPKVYPGETATISYRTAGADLVRIEPGGAELDPSSGAVTVQVDAYTEYTCSAWRDGVREVHELTVEPIAPTVQQFEFLQNWVMPDEPPWLKWSVDGADSIWIRRPGGIEFEVSADDSLLVDPPEYGWWKLFAINAVGTSQGNDELYAPYLAVEEFRADPPVVLRGESTTLHWDIANALDVEILGEGTYPPTGELVVSPDQSRGYEMYAHGPDRSLYRVAPVRVDLDGAHPATIMVSASPDSFVHEPVPIDTGSTMEYDVYVRIENVWGTVRSVNFALQWPEWLAVDSWQLNGEGSWSQKSPSSNFGVYTLLCETDVLQSTWVARFRFAAVADPPPGSVPVISIHPGLPDLARPIRPQWDWCGQSTSFEFTLPGMGLVPAEPMRLLAPGVPIHTLPLSVAWSDAGLRLKWSGLPQIEGVRTEIQRGAATGPLASVAWVEGLEWLDSDASRLYGSSGLRYRVVARTPDGSSFQSEEVRVEESPPQVRPTRTRLVGARPNPFNPRTTISWELAEAGPVRLSIHDLAGRLVRRWELPGQTPGTGAVEWDGTDRRGRRAASGVYLVRLDAGGARDAVRVTLLK